MNAISESLPVAPNAAATAGVRGRGIHVLMGASGFAGLGYQIVWTQQCALWLGHETAAVLAVVAAFFGGLAVGAWTLGPFVERHARPARVYAACELVIGAWGSMLAFVMEPASHLLLAAIGADASPSWQWLVGFLGTFVLLLPATAAMGATLPAIERVLATGTSARSIAGLYAANTVGAMVGVLAMAAWAIPTLGLVRSSVACALVNAVCAAIAWRLTPNDSRPMLAPATVGDAGPRRSVAWRLACTGFLGIGYEVVVVRVLSQVTEDTVYTFAALLAVYLAGTAVGAAAWQRLRRAGADSAADLDRTVLRLVAAVLVGAATLWQAEAIRDGAHAFVGSGMAAALAVETLLALAAFALPTIAMGALFGQLSAMANATGLGFGRGLAINTFGAAFAPWVFGVWIAPGFGAKVALVAIVAGYTQIGSAGRRRVPIRAAAVVVLVVVGFALPRLAFVDVPDGGRIIDYREGPIGAVSVVEGADGTAVLRIDNRAQEGSSATRFVDARQALLPIALVPDARRALFLGLGSGVTASSAAELTSLDVDVVELLPEVIAASAHFTREAATGTRLHPIAMDARRFVRTTDRRYDLVVADNFHPARAGSGSLYTVEHFAAIRDRIARQGLFCQWLPLHQLDLATLRSIVRAYLAVWPDATAILASNSLATPVLGLVARDGGTGFDPVAIRTGLAARTPPPSWAAYRLDDEFAVLGSFVAGPSALTRFAGDAPVNTDDRPVVSYRAPRATYAPVSTSTDRLIALLDAFGMSPADVLSASTDGATRARFAAYWSARDRFIVAGQHVTPSSDPVAMLARLRAPLLAILGTSPDFRPAYDPLVRLALASAASDPAGARSLLRTLQRVVPARREARDALRHLGDD